jgi:outer membrane protein assembly factor BamB
MTMYGFLTYFRAAPVLVCLAGFAASAALAGDWPQFLGPTRNGISTEAGLNWRWAPGGPATVWRYPLGHGWSGPAVADGRLFIFHRVEDDDTLDCLDPSTGTRVWRWSRSTEYRDEFGFDNGPRATPTVAGKRVVILGADGHLDAIDVTSGRHLWGRDLHAEYKVPQGFFGAAGSPLVDGDRVMLNVGGRGAGIVAFDVDTGKELWKATDDAAGYASPVAATVNGARTVFVFTRDGIVVLDPATGAVRARERWRSRQQASVNAATPLVVGDELFVSACYGTGAGVWRVRGNSLEPIWKKSDALDSHYSTAVVRDGYLYGSHDRQEAGASLRCVEWATGKVRWERERLGCATLVAVDGRLLALTERGEFVAFAASPDGYREEVRAKVLEAPCRAAFALAGGRVYARDAKALICLDLNRH